MARVICRVWSSLSRRCQVCWRGLRRGTRIVAANAQTPRWTSAGTVAAAVMTLVAALGWSRQHQLDYHLQILDAIEKIRCAELAYAAARPDRAFTCNGPDLAGLQTADWRTDPQMAEVGVRDRSQTHIVGTSTCDAIRRRTGGGWTLPPGICSRGMSRQRDVWSIDSH